ncbi:hypothetical protein [Variovorax paradoxus]|nr:hypothetical protein [Variovorax paradoxus]
MYLPLAIFTCLAAVGSYAMGRLVLWIEGMSDVRKFRANSQ